MLQERKKYVCIHGKSWCRPCERNGQKADTGQSIDRGVGRKISSASYEARKDGLMVIYSQYESMCFVCKERWPVGARIQKTPGPDGGSWVHETCWEEAKEMSADLTIGQRFSHWDSLCQQCEQEYFIGDIVRYSKSFRQYVHAECWLESTRNPRSNK